MEITKIDKAMMKTAYLWSELSYCERRQVGACRLYQDVVIKNMENVDVKKIY